MKYIYKYLLLFTIGGFIYTAIEIIYRMMLNHNPSHWSMFVVGGVVFVLIGMINEFFDYKMPFWKQVAIGTFDVVVVEFISGCVLNIWLKLNIWDYSNLPLNLLGQICVPFILLWIPLVAFAIVADDYLRYWMFEDEEKPHYNFSLK